MAQWNASGLYALSTSLDALANPDVAPLMGELCEIIDADNEQGLMSGQDKDGEQFARVTYRPKTKHAKKWNRSKQNRLARRSVFTGALEHSETAYNNLTPAEYRMLAGPPLVPRGFLSRLITNFYVGWQKVMGVANTWKATGAWAGIVNSQGKEFMQAHFNGESTGKNHRVKLPRRDPRGVRPWGRARAAEAVDRWARALVAKTIGKAA